MLDSYTTLDDVKADLDQVGVQDDELLTNYILDAKAYIDAELGYSFGQTGTTISPVIYTYSGFGRVTMQVDPILSVSQVLVNYPVPQTGPTPVPLDITWDIVIAKGSLEYGLVLVRNYGRFPLGMLNITVSGIWGRIYDIEPVPPPISRANRRLAVHWYKMRDTQYADSIMSRETGIVKYTKVIPQDVDEILKRYRPRSFRSRSPVSRPWGNFSIGDW